MKTTIALAFAASVAAGMFTTAATAQETVTTVVADTTVAVVDSDSDSPAASPLVAMFAAICGSTAALSDAAQAACATDTMPDPVRAGDRWPNRSIGAELNVIARNISAFAAAE